MLLKMQLAKVKLVIVLAIPDPCNPKLNQNTFLDSQKKNPS